jgi:hypothetical protein
MEYRVHQQPEPGLRPQIAEALGENPDIMKGYLVVGVRIDDSMVVAHNTCCLGHMIGIVISELKGHPEMNTPNDEFREGHES